MLPNAESSEESIRPSAPTRGFGRPELLVVVAAFLWSSGGLGVKSIVHLPALGIAGLRGFFAALGMGFVTAWMAKKRQVRVGTVLRRPWVLAAAVAYTITVISFVLAARLTTATNAILIQYTGPVYVAVLSWPLLGERPRPVDWIAIAGCLLGMLVCVSGEKLDFGASSQGLAFAVVSSFGFASLPLCLRKDSEATRRQGLKADGISPMVAMTLGNVFASLALFAVPAAVWACDLHDLGIAAFLGIGQIAIPYVLYGLAVQHISALKSSLLAFVEPVLTPLWVFLGIGEIPSAAAGLGGVIILVSLALQSAARRPAAPEVPQPAAG